MWKRIRRKSWCKVSQVLGDKHAVMLLLADDTAFIVQHNSQPNNALGTGILVSARTVPGELDRFSTDGTVLLHKI